MRRRERPELGGPEDLTRVALGEVHGDAVVHRGRRSGQRLVEVVELPELHEHRCRRDRRRRRRGVAVARHLSLGLGRGRCTRLGARFCFDLGLEGGGCGDPAGCRLGLDLGAATGGCGCRGASEGAGECGGGGVRLCGRAVALTPCLGRRLAGCGRRGLGLGDEGHRLLDDDLATDDAPLRLLRLGGFDLHLVVADRVSHDAADLAELLPLGVELPVPDFLAARVQIARPVGRSLLGRDTVGLLGLRSAVRLHVEDGLGGDLARGLRLGRNLSAVRRRRRALVGDLVPVGDVTGACGRSHERESGHHHDERDDGLHDLLHDVLLGQVECGNLPR